MIKEIVTEVNFSIEQALNYIQEKDFLSFLLLVGRADKIDGQKQTCGTDYVIEYVYDRAMDETRDRFYLRYLNKNYNKEGFDYSGEYGLDCLSIEMMIYTHLWDSLYFLKSLIRIASLVQDNKYNWDPIIKDSGKWEFIRKSIIQPIKAKNFSLGSIIEKGYSSDIRNAFAHSLYSIYPNTRTIDIRPKRGHQSLKFEDFQRKFLYSIILMNKMQNIQEFYHDKYASIHDFSSDIFETPDGLKVCITTKQIPINGIIYPEFRMVKIDNI